MSTRSLLIFVGLSGAVMVALGAYGAHELKGAVDSGLLSMFQKGVRYQSSHTLALFGTAIFLMHYPKSQWMKIAASAFCIGIILFSGSLYIAVFMGIESIKILTPLGGVAFIAGWLSLSWAAYRDIPLHKA